MKGNIMKRKKEREKGKERRRKNGPNVGIEPATSYSGAHVITSELPPQGLIAHTIGMHIYR